MDNITIIGLVAAGLTTFSFAPQVIKSWKLKETKDISLGMYIAFCSGVFMWTVYGFLVNDLPIILANIITFVLAASVLFLKIKYK
ncbi:MAG: SemiSWEET transporter [Candidatus Spechtbacterales bacterium]|nr:SemiSWEET transporter [Candidatus Spechtbacterales bacterium]